MQHLWFYKAIFRKSYNMNGLKKKTKTNKRTKHSISHSLIIYLSYSQFTNLSEDVAGQGLIQPWLHVYELKEVQTISMFLHHHLEVTSILEHFHHLVARASKCTFNGEHHEQTILNFCDIEMLWSDNAVTLTMLWCCSRVSMAISWLTLPNMGSSTQESLTILALLINFTTTYRFQVGEKAISSLSYPA